ncbi:MAG: protoheme IX farnesyltransferase [Flavobacteriaceae bacterium]|jgi:heme o synthase|nr:protoheme IX farnesyltransferase [Flavobacteriaceae bacterium]MBT4113115.1 protoheme IX farnesyltransferase [Flavobacteriaceae bacterium]MBT4613894.1 protoheme IX farnesyltransferase [Flavobacteriaceae bacterium]MBT5246144.1 protoheme IX farnesyltransferase [Flavobacteriaceae bacterium]MBT5650589.1 protoheme IX farnesyltransferase [Flavobacteriaceae bacterium]
MSIKSLFDLTKFRLTLSVVFSSFISYMLGFKEFDIKVLILLILGGIFVVSASNIYNQIIERDLDALMSRTKNRPLPTNRISVNMALILAIFLTITGIALLYTINPKVALLAAISIFLYVAVYTPLKLITPLSVFVGAIPGALPFMLGWVAATGEIGIEAVMLFLMQFFWQFPHFWSIGWMQNKDYEKAGFKMLPTGKKDRSTTSQILFYSIWAVLMSIVPAFNLTGDLFLSIYGLILVLMIGLGLIYYAVKLFIKSTDLNAKKLMLASISYLTLMQIVLLLDKFLR